MLDLEAGCLSLLPQERERRVAKKKLAESAKRLAAAKKRAAEQAADDQPKSFPPPKAITPAVSASKTPNFSANTKRPYNHRRTGG